MSEELLDKDETTKTCIIGYCTKDTTHSRPMPFCDQHFNFLDYWWRGTLLLAHTEAMVKAVGEIKGHKVHSGYKYVDAVLLSDALEAIRKVGKE